MTKGLKIKTISSAAYITAKVGIRQGIIHAESIVFESSACGLTFLHAAYDALEVNYPKFFKMDALCKLGTLAAHCLLKEFDKDQYLPQEVAIVLSNNSASIEADVNYFESAKTFPSPSLFVYTLPNIIIGEISIRYGFKGENAFFISETFNADWLYFYVTDLMQQRNIKACICGWVDVLNDDYNAQLFLVEKEKRNGITFTAQNLNLITNSR